jgi:hypothetical protein
MNAILLTLLLAAAPLDDVCRTFLAMPADEAQLAKRFGVERSRRAETVRAAHEAGRMDTKTTARFDNAEAVIYQWPGGAPKLVELRIFKRVTLKPPLPVNVGDRLAADTTHPCVPHGPTLRLQQSAGRVSLIEWKNWPAD